MQLIADSGGSGTTWALINNAVTTFYEGVGMHPDVVTNNTKLPFELMQYITHIKEVRFYGTGCASIPKAEKVKKYLRQRFHNANVYVYSDLLALAHPVFGHKKGLVAILGTGSSMSFYDGENLHFEVYSPGQQIDPGSGPVIGKALLQKYLDGELSKEAREIFDNLTNLRVDNIFSVNETNKLLFQNLHIPEFYSVCRESFVSFLDYYEPIWKKNKHPIVFGGSIAALGFNVLAEVLREHSIPLAEVVRYPIKKLASHFNK